MADEEIKKVETEAKVEDRPELKLDKKQEKEDQPKAAPPAYLKRAEMLKEIADDNRDKRDKDLDGQSDEERAEEISSQEGQQLEAKAETKETLAEVKPEVQKRKFIVDGKDVELTDEEITAYVQKSATADKRLKEATEILQQARTSVKPLPATSNADVGSDHPESFTQDAAPLAKALMYGNEEEATQAIAKILGRGRQSGDAQIVSHLTTQTKDKSNDEIAQVVNEAMAFHLAKESLDKPPEQGGYGDIWNDPMLQKMFMQKEAELRDSGDRRPYKEIYNVIATDIRTWRESVVKKFAPPTTGLEDRDKQKAQTGVVRAASAKPVMPQESKPKTHDEKLEAMRRTRGQAN